MLAVFALFPWMTELYHGVMSSVIVILVWAGFMLGIYVLASTGQDKRKGPRFVVDEHASPKADENHSSQSKP